MEMARRIKDRREYLRRSRPTEDWTQASIAERLSEMRGLPLTRTGYAHYEDGENEIAATDLQYLADILKIRIDYLYGLVTDQETADDETIALYRGLDPASKAIVGAVTHQVAAPKLAVHAANDRDEVIHGITTGKKAE